VLRTGLTGGVIQRDLRSAVFPGRLRFQILDSSVRCGFVQTGCAAEIGANVLRRFDQLFQGGLPAVCVDLQTGQDVWNIR